MTANQRFAGWFSSAGKAASNALPVRLGGHRLPGTLAAPARLSGIDWTLVWVTVALLLSGLIMVYSATVAMPDNPKFARYAHTHFLMRHVLSLVVAFLVALLAFQVCLGRQSRSASFPPYGTPQQPSSWLFQI